MIICLFYLALKTLSDVITELTGLRNIVCKDRPDYTPYFDCVILDLNNLEKKPKRNFKEVAQRMIDTYKEYGCVGQKNIGSTSKPWTGSVQLIEKRLMSDRIDLSSYTDEQIVDATRRYINCIDKTYKRVLPYFIWKEEGGFHSDLLDYLDMEQGDEQQQDTNWLYK